MARGTIARLQQRELAADGARHDCAPAAAGAGRRWHGGDIPLHLLDTAVDEGAQDQMHSQHHHDASRFTASSQTLALQCWLEQM